MNFSVFRLTHLFILSSLFTLIQGCASRPEKTHFLTQPIECSYNGGFLAYNRGTAYDNSCDKDEMLFLTRYRISRKLNLVQTEIKNIEHKKRCLELERDLKYSSSVIPFRVELTTSERVSKPLKENDCPNTLFTTESGLSQEISLVLFEIDKLEKKRIAIKKLHEKLLSTPENIQTLVNEYKTISPQDVIDIDFNWKDHLEKSKGYQNLSSFDQSLLIKEIYKTPEMKSEIINRSLIGFGLAQRYQNQEGWLKYTVLDSFIAATLLYGIQNKDRSIYLPLLVFGIPISRTVQFIDAYENNLSQNIDFENLRTQKISPSFQITFNFEF